MLDCGEDKDCGAQRCCPDDVRQRNKPLASEKDKDKGGKSKVNVPEALTDVVGESLKTTQV